MKKKIDYILQGREKQITKEETVLQPLPHKDFRFANPFIVLHHMRPAQIKPGSAQRIHPHPHRGFAPVTFMLQGEGYHKDNAGHDEIVRAGDVQWMFAGKGILHSEGPSDEMLKTGGIYELIQIWVNVPRVNKWDEPSYQRAAKAEQPQVLQQEGVDLRLVSGAFEGKTGPIRSFSPVISISGSIAQGKQVELTANPGYWTLIYIAKGNIDINQKTVSAGNLVIFGKENEDIILTAEEDVQLLFLSAEPIDDPVAAKENFVMNTVEENDQAIADYNNGLFGSLEF